MKDETMIDANKTHAPPMTFSMIRKRPLAAEWDTKFFEEHIANNRFAPRRPWYKKAWDWLLIKLNIKEPPKSVISFNPNQPGVTVDEDGNVKIQLLKDHD